MRQRYKGSWLQLASGILMVLAGIISFFMPNIFTDVLLYLASFTILISGISSLVFFYRNRKSPFLPVGILFNGILNVVLGVLLLFVDSVALGVVFSYILGAWFIVQAIAHVAACVGLKRFGFSQWWLSIISAVLSVVLAIFIFVNPVATVFAVAMMAGIYMLISGIVRIVEFFTYR